MPRKAFLADVTTAAGRPIPNVSDLARGDDDGDVNFVYTPPSGAPITIGLLALEVSEYPPGNTYMIFTKSSDIPTGVNAALDSIASSADGMSVEVLVTTITSKLHSILATGSKKNPLSIDSDIEMMDSTDSDEDRDGEEEEEEDDDYGYDDGFSDDEFEPADGRRSSISGRLTPEAATKLNRRIKADLRAVKFSKFKVGILSGMTAESHSCLISISVQASRLGLSEEVLHAWGLEPEQYIVLLIRYSSGYKTFESIIYEPAKSLDISFRVGICDKYKPTVSQAQSAFSDHTKDTLQTRDDEKKDSLKPTGIFSNIFVSSSLDEFTNEQFISLVKIRNSMALGWDGAKLFYNDRLGRQDEKKGDLPEHFFEESKPKQSSLPDITNADHLTDDSVRDISFPLIAAQFTMRYLLRCTEFCLVCHDRIGGDFEALKPYVCTKPLCLYQYMSLGFGPSIEHEILSQPYVVDLLVSFCYAAAHNQRIREYPTGMSLAVPYGGTSVTISHLMRAHYPAPTVSAMQSLSDVPSAIDVRFDKALNDIVFDGTTPCSLRNGDWIMLVFGNSWLHFRVEDISLYPTIKLSSTPISAREIGAPNTATIDPATPATTPPPVALIPAKMSKYDQNFDDMTDIEKAATIIMLLGTLPSIIEMRTYLLQQSPCTVPNLRLWKDRISPAALGLLRWIIASNRSSLVQVDSVPTAEGETMATKFRLDQKCANVAEGWVQFRFAQGSPDKEQRFLNALKTEKANLDAKYPTLFAWHGSPLQNWHSIIRHGLDFTETLHGRAFGNGVYHAIDQAISVGYSGHGATCWPGSELNIKSAMSLNEIVNYPTKYQSRSPYLVVQYVDWIQCRYLMVQNTTNIEYGAGVAAVEAQTEDGHVHQDPAFAARSTTGKPVGIPLCAVSISKAFRATANAEQTALKSIFLRDILAPNKRQQSGSKSGLLEMDGATSDDEDIEDINFLFSDDETKDKDKGKATKNGVKLTDFFAGSLDQSGLPMLDPPEYATPAATMRLNKELKTIYKIQESTPSDELGWYINQGLISNVYQWVVELHSFEESLPLAQDMKKAGATSIVLEIRFGKDYPHSPPFVRVIRPRFLPFTQGGGGHVTIGGAMCMELLTNSGWSAVSSIESVLLQVRMAIMNLEPRPARLMTTAPHIKGQDYATGEAVAAYIRACQVHGWEVPKDFNDFARGMGPGMY
ncbi:hypothetical protein BJ878DRAFT_137512 [Calycina marina]|uniref:UBC core domain-containing protein n=1 Tax=Calycina marina TaxID=1763456 RepID=A0A9P7YZW3_9HELO|nr:hypothetical protein BJ878DRAFT_137512 [Calycina marina]